MSDKNKTGKTEELTKVEVERLRPVLNFGVIFNAALDNLGPDQLLVAWELLDLLQGLTKERTEEARKLLLDMTLKSGALTEKGHLVMEIDGTTITRQKSKGKTLSEEFVEKLIESRHLAREQAFSQATVWVVDPSKIDDLINTGRLTKEEVEAGYKETFSLKVKESEGLQEMLDAIKDQVGSVQPPKALLEKKKGE